MNPIFEYVDYRAYLRDYYEHAKKTRRAFNYRAFAAKAGLASPMHLRLVMTGERNLTQKTLPKFARGLGLAEKESEYFENLVYFTQARASSDKLRYLARLSKIKARGAATRMSQAQQKSLFAKWCYVVVYELALVPDFEEDAAWISRRLGRAISPAEAREALLELERSKLLIRDEAGRLRQNHAQVQTDDEIENLLIREYHRTMAVRASERVDDPLDQREFGFVTVCTTREKFERMKLVIKEFIRDSNASLSCDALAEGDRVIAQLNVQLFKLA